MNELSDKNRPKKLEDIFRVGLEEAEMAPSDLLWSRIERDLNIKETGYYKERLVWYQRLAAACVVLVLCAGAYIFLETRQENLAVLTAPTEIAKTPETPVPAPASRQASLPVTEMAPRKAGSAAAALSSPEATVAAKTVTQTIRQDDGNVPGKKYRNTSGGYPGGKPAAGLHTVAAAQPEGTTRSGAAGLSAARKSRSFPPATPDHHLLARVRQPLATSPQAPLNPDSLAPVLTWPGLGRLAALTDAVPASRSSFAAAPLPADEPAVNKGSAGARWRFGGKYASQYFDQNIVLAGKPMGLANNAVVPSSMLPLASAGTTSYADALKEFDQETASGFSFNTGISAAYRLNKHLDLETGLGYTQNVATTNTSYIFNNAQIGPRYTAESSFWGANDMKSAPGATGIPATAFLATLAGGPSLNQTAITKTQAFDTQYRYRLLGIPIKVSYQTSRNKSFYFASMGMLTNLLVQANILSDSDRVPDLHYAPHEEDSPFRNWHFAAVASAGKGFGIGSGLQIRAGLEATQYLSNLTHHPDYPAGKQRKPYTIGLALSSSYTFGK
jgi:hypothetical protein